VNDATPLQGAYRVWRADWSSLLSSFSESVLCSAAHITSAVIPCLYQLGLDRA
jgi:hypothetical protein